MPTGAIVRPNDYHDSVFLMRVARRVTAEPGIMQASAVMGTEQNKRLLAESGLAAAGIDAAGPNDLILALKGGRGKRSRRRWPGRTSGCGRRKVPSRTSTAEPWPRPWIVSPMPIWPSSRCRVSTPAARRGRPWRTGLQCLLFSNNVPLAEEISLKALRPRTRAHRHGPGLRHGDHQRRGSRLCQRVRRARSASSAPSGTGIQEFTCLVHRAGAGISHAIGTGSNDLSEAVGGLFFPVRLGRPGSRSGDEGHRGGVQAAGSRDARRSGRKICPLSKARRRLLSRSRAYVSAGPSAGASRPVPWTRRLPGCSARRRSVSSRRDPAGASPRTQGRETSQIRPEQRFSRGLFAGGTFCYQAQQIFREPVSRSIPTPRSRAAGNCPTPAQPGA